METNATKVNTINQFPIPKSRKDQDYAKLAKHFQRTKSIKGLTGVTKRINYYY